jgi:hypothetical protein
MKQLSYALSDTFLLLFYSTAINCTEAGVMDGPVPGPRLKLDNLRSTRAQAQTSFFPYTQNSLLEGSSKQDMTTLKEILALEQVEQNRELSD